MFLYLIIAVSFWYYPVSSLVHGYVQADERRAQTRPHC